MTPKSMEPTNVLRLLHVELNFYAENNQGPTPGGEFIIHNIRLNKHRQPEASYRGRTVFYRYVYPAPFITAVSHLVWSSCMPNFHNKEDYKVSVWVTTKHAYSRSPRNLTSKATACEQIQSDQGLKHGLSINCARYDCSFLRCLGCSVWKSTNRSNL